MNFMVLSFALLLFQASPAQTPSAQAPASIAGFVVKLGTNEPLSKAVVTLNGTEGRGQMYSASTSTDGRFLLDKIPPGKYRLAANRSGYVRYEFGARGPNRRGLDITVGAGQRMTQIMMPLSPAATITGRVFDRDGEPLAYVTVQAMKYVYQDGERVLNVAQTAVTNDLGEYRLFWLQPGQYFVSTTYDSSPQRGGFGGPGRPIFLGPRGGNPGIESVEATEDQARIPIYYPGTPDPQAAAPINLQTGTLFSGVDLTVAAVHTFTVRGQVISGATGQPIANVNVVLEPRQRPGSRGPIMRSRANGANRGSFEIGGIVPGSYDLVAISNDRNNRMSARVPVDVSGSDIQNVSVVLTPGFAVPGHLIVEGPAQDPTRIRITLRPSASGMQFGGAIPAAPVQADGTFTLQQVGQDIYRMNWNGLPRGFYVKAARLGAVDVLKDGLKLERQPTVPLEVVISSDTGTVDATVVTDKQEPSINTTFVLVPSPDLRFRNDLYRMGATDAMGRLHLDGVPPGDYKAFAWEEVENGAWQDADFIQPFEDRGKPIRVSANSAANLELRVITP
jgi:Carboxypeptidase regulatory-like domain